MKKPKEKPVRYSVKIYFKAADPVQSDILKRLHEVSQALGVSLSDAGGMALRRGLPLVKGDWDDIIREKQSKK